MAYIFEGKNREDNECYTDFEFSNGDPCKLLVLTRDHDANEWSGIVLTSDTPDGAFDHDTPMPRDVLADLVAIAEGM